jgi:hypothetical protein
LVLPLAEPPIVPRFDLRWVEPEEFSERRSPVPLVVGLLVLHVAAVVARYRWRMAEPEFVVPMEGGSIVGSSSEKPSGCELGLVSVHDRPLLPERSNP